MSEYIHKSHNVTVLLYHLVFPAKYRRAVFDEEVDEVLREVCADIEKRYEIKFVEIGVDRDHVHFLVQSVPNYSVTKIVKMLKSLTAREIFKRCLMFLQLRRYRPEPLPWKFVYTGSESLREMSERWQVQVLTHINVWQPENPWISHINKELRKQALVSYVNELSPLQAAGYLSQKRVSCSSR